MLRTFRLKVQAVARASDTKLPDSNEAYQHKEWNDLDTKSSIILS